MPQRIQHLCQDWYRKDRYNNEIMFFPEMCNYANPTGRHEETRFRKVRVQTGNSSKTNQKQYKHPSQNQLITKQDNSHARKSYARKSSTMDPEREPKLIKN